MVTLYTTGCSRCTVLESKLDSKQIHYRKEEDTNLMLEKGIKSVPVLEVQGQRLNFLEAVQWVNNQGERA